jgi:hypothetical protein
MAERHRQVTAFILAIALISAGVTVRGVTRVASTAQP